MQRTESTIMLAISLICIFPASASARLEERIGPQPEAYVQSTWPGGIAPLLRHESRVFSRWVNGNSDFYFNADLPQLKQLIDTYADMRLRDHCVYLRQKSPVIKSLKGEAFSYTAHLKFLEGIALWHVRSTTDDAVTLEPELTLYVSGAADLAFLQDYDWPEHLMLDSDVEGLKLPAGRKRPARKKLHTNVQFDDGGPAFDHDARVSTKVTLWEKNQADGIWLGEVRHDGTFAVAFSKDEIQRLNDGRLWLTLTAGNLAVQAKPDDPRLSILSFRLKPENVQPVQIPQPSYYHGQLLFEDGSPPRLDPQPWPGAVIRISFPFGTSVQPDHDGRFRLFLTPAQLDQLKKRKQRKNVFVPQHGQQNRSRAMHVYPVDQLATSPALVKPVLIPRPVTPVGPDE